MCQRSRVANLMDEGVKHTFHSQPLHIQVTVGRVRERYVLKPCNHPLNLERQLTVRRNRLKRK